MASQYLKGTYKQAGNHLFIQIVIEQGGNGFQRKKGRFRLDIREKKIFHNEGDEALDQLT